MRRREFISLLGWADGQFARQPPLAEALVDSSSPSEE
jgi:hypothetical protein